MILWTKKRSIPLRKQTKYLPLLLASTTLLASPFLYANEYSPTLQGVIGLNTVPSARMAEAGTLRAGISTLDPYIHSFTGLQLSRNLYIGTRQSAAISSLTQDAKSLHPGIDLKLQLLEETRSRPAVAIGLQSAFGHKRMAGEYITLSKRYKSFDFTLGAGWGRYGTAGHIKNPLKNIAGHFGKNRSIDGEEANKPHDWFTGEEIGFFGGIEYFTPIKSLSLKADWGADRYEAEHAAYPESKPAPWSLSANYKPTQWADFNLGMQGTDKIMARLTLSTNPNLWDWTKDSYKPAPPMRPFRAANTSKVAIRVEAAKSDILLHNIQQDEQNITAHMPLHPYHNTPYQLGRAAQSIANNSAANTHAITLIPTIHNLQGPAIRLMRSDLENALIHNHGSPEEIWQNTAFNADKNHPNQTQPYRKSNGFFHEFIPEITLENKISVNEEDHGTLYRTSLIAGSRKATFFGLLTSAASLRLNIRDNLEKLDKTRLRPLLPVRSNEQDFAKDTIALETLYSSYTHSFTPSTHIAITNGFVEEMYAAMGGEILYRPYNAKWAIGAEAWLAMKRDPSTSMHMGLNGDSLLTGHINGWYDLPEQGLTLQAKIGRYLAEDIGATLSLNKNFKNGTEIKSFITLTDQADIDVFGGTTHAYGGLNLTIPLGKIPYIPHGSKAQFTTAPFGRDTGQHLNNPISLYDLTTPFSYRHITENWGDIVR